MDATPLRGLGRPGPDGYVLLRDAEIGYRDGGEQQVLELIRAASDLSSAGDELIRRADGWAQTYHLHPARANIVRCLKLPADARVLEIGAGCGAITRYLGETCALVDALEPVPVRAAAARARTRDLDNVEVFVGELSDVPAEAAYDVVVVIGVLEYVGNGTDDPAPYLDFLRGIQQRLVEGGTLVLAIENALGAKYFAGAPEDHSNRLFDSLEGYPADAPARTFSRAQLEAMFRTAGLAPSFRAAFPDYKISRTVLGEFPEPARSLLHRIPQFPSPDWMGHRPRLVDEGSLWRTLVEARLEADTGNSLLVLADKPGAAAQQVWPDGVAGVYYSVGRRTAYTAQTVVRADGDSVRFHRNLVSPGARRPDDVFTMVESDYPYEPGEDLLDHIARRKDADVAGLLAGWLKILDSADGELSLDLLPHNLVLDPSGELRVVDIELLHPAPREQVVRRGVYWAAYKVARLSAFDRWPGLTRVIDLTRHFGALAGLDEAGSWIDTAVAEEAVVQTEIHFAPPDGTPHADAVAERVTALRSLLEQGLLSMPLGLRPDGAVLAANEELVMARDDLQRRLAGLERELTLSRGDVAELRARCDTLEQERAVIEASRAMRLTRAYRRKLEKALPEGSRRRDAYLRLTNRQS